MGTLRFFEEVVSFKIRRTFGFADYSFRPAGRIPDFFTRNYDHPIVEEGVLLRDMILLEQPLGTE